ncbi:hypothetical protein CDAR_123891, partial [Caerostris darwini]
MNKTLGEKPGNLGMHAKFSDLIICGEEESAYAFHQ